MTSSPATTISPAPFSMVALAARVRGHGASSGRPVLCEVACLRSSRPVPRGLTAARRAAAARTAISAAGRARRPPANRRAGPRPRHDHRRRSGPGVRGAGPGGGEWRRAISGGGKDSHQIITHGKLRWSNSSPVGDSHRRRGTVIAAGPRRVQTLGDLKQRHYCSDDRSRSRLGTRRTNRQ